MWGRCAAPGSPVAYLRFGDCRAQRSGRAAIRPSIAIRWLGRLRGRLLRRSLQLLRMLLTGLGGGLRRRLDGVLSDLFTVLNCL